MGAFPQEAAQDPSPDGQSAVQWIPFAPYPLEGYPTRPSVARGERIDFCVSGTVPSYDIEFLRIGEEEILLAEVKGLAASPQPIPPRAYAVGCGWQTSHRLVVPLDWASGLYVARLQPSPPGVAPSWEIPFTVRESVPGRTSRILTLSPDCTAQAYNAWGGASLYGSLYGPPHPVVSFLRPLDPATPGVSQWPRNFLRWLEAQHLPVEYASEVDLHGDLGLLDPYDLLLLFGHHEYWSRRMRDAVDAFVGGGGRVLILTGNTCTMQIRFEQGDTAIRCHKVPSADPFFASEALFPLVTTAFAVPPVLDPEDRTVGLGFRNAAWTGDLFDSCAPGWAGGTLPCYPVSQGYGYWRLVTPEHPAFAGLGWRAGDLFGRETFPSAGPGISLFAVSGEVDGAPREILAGRPVASEVAGSPRNLISLADAPAWWGFTTFTTHDNLGTVVNAGSGGYPLFPFNPPPTCSIRHLERVTQNLLGFLSRPRRSLVRNGGFERWAEGNPIAFEARGPVEPAREEVPAGRLALRVPEGPARLAQRVPDLQGGQRYSLGFFARASGDGASVALRDGRTGGLVCAAAVSGRGEDYFTAFGEADPGDFTGLLEIDVPNGIELTLDCLELWNARTRAAEALRPSDASTVWKTGGGLAIPLGRAEGGNRFLVSGEAEVEGGAGSIRLLDRGGGGVVGEWFVTDPRMTPFAFLAADRSRGQMPDLSIFLRAPEGGELRVRDLEVLPLRVPSPSSPAVPRNGGFETPIAEAWTAFGGALAGQEFAAALSGRACLELHAAAGPGGVEQKLDPLEEPGRYLVSAWLLTGAPGAEIRLVSARDGTVLWARPAPSRGEWGVVQGEVELSEATLAGGVSLALLVPAGKVLLADSVRVRRTEEILVEDAYGNGAFEIGPVPAEVRAGSSWERRPPDWIFDLPSRLLLDDAFFFRGRRSLRIDGSGGAWTAYSRITEPLRTREPWRLRAKAYCGAGATLALNLKATRFGEWALVELGRAGTTTQGAWEDLEISFTPPRFFGDLAVEGWIFLTATGGTAWIDELTVETDP